MGMGEAGSRRGAECPLLARRCPVARRRRDVGRTGEGRQRGYQGREWWGRLSRGRRYAKDARGRKACIAPGRAGHRGLTGAADLGRGGHRGLTAAPVDRK